MNSRYFGSRRPSTASGEGANSTAPCGAVEDSVRSAEIGTIERTSGRLRHHRDEARRDENDLADLAGDEVVGDAGAEFARAFDLGGRAEGGFVGNVLRETLGGVAGFGADRIPDDVGGLAAERVRGADDVGVEGAGGGFLSAVIKMMPRGAPAAPAFMKGWSTVPTLAISSRSISLIALA